MNDQDIQFMDRLKMKLEIVRLRDAIRKHRDYRGDDRCHEDDTELYQSLPEGYTPPAKDSCVELEQCKKYIACRHNPATEYVSPQRRIEALEGLLKDAAYWIVKMPQTEALLKRIEEELK